MMARQPAGVAAMPAARKRCSTASTVMRSVVPDDPFFGADDTGFEWEGRMDALFEREVSFGSPVGAVPHKGEGPHDRLHEWYRHA